MAPSTISELLHWSYANLAMAHAALTQNATSFGRVHFMVRSRLFKGLQTGSMSVGSMLDDERLKLVLPQACCYCGSRELLTLDHLIASSLGGPDAGDNIVWSCRSCNSSKGARDLLDWYAVRGQFPPLLLLRRYLKLALAYCRDRELLEIPLIEAPEMPFTLRAVPQTFPTPGEMVLWCVPLA